MSETKAPKALHRRSINHQTWQHEDGSLEIVRVLLDPDGVIQDIRLRMDSTPFEICPEVIRRFEDLRGARMAR